MKKKVLLLILLAITISNLLGQPGTLDSTFGTSGVVSTWIQSRGDDHANSVAIQQDGKIVVAGYSMGSDYMYDFAIARFNIDGTLDASFGNSGKVVTDFSGNDASANAIAIQNNGKIVVAGSCAGNFEIVRYNTNGSIDSLWGIYGKVSTDFFGGDAANSVVVQQDGKIVVAGNSSGDFAIARYNTNSSLDSLWGTNGKVLTDFSGNNDIINSIAIQQDGKIIAAGISSDDFAIARYNTDGSIDSLFGIDGKVITDFGGIDNGNSIALQADGKIVVVGSSMSDFAIARYDTSGFLDNTFGISGKVTTPIGDSAGIAHSTVIQPDGKIIAVGETYNYSTSKDFALIRYNSDGALDTTFGTMGKVITVIGDGDNTGNAVALQSDNKLIVAGVAYFFNMSNPRDKFVLAKYINNSPVEVTNYSNEYNSIVVYPSPATDHLNIQINDSNNNEYTFEIYNSLGTKINSFRLSSGQNTVQSNSESSGIYLYNILLNNRMVKSGMIMLQH